MSRLTHVGKTPEEHAAYRDFLRSKTSIEKTIADRENFNQSDKSPVEEDKLADGRISKKSFKLKAKDFFNNNWIVTLVGGLILALIIAVGNFLIDVHTSNKILEKELSRIDKDISDIELVNKESNSKLHEIEIFIRELAKDLEFISKGSLD